MIPYFFHCQQKSVYSYASVYTSINYLLMTSQISSNLLNYWSFKLKGLTGPNKQIKIEKQLRFVSQLMRSRASKSQVDNELDD